MKNKVFSVLLAACILLTVMLPASAAVEPVMLYQIEFDGSESTANWYYGGINYGSTPLTDFASNISNGQFVFKPGAMSEHLRYAFPTPLDMTGRSSIVVETKVSFGERFPQTGYWFFRITDELNDPEASIVRLMGYAGNIQSNGRVFGTPDPKKSYIIQAELNFVTHKQSLVMYEEGGRALEAVVQDFNIKNGADPSTATKITGFGFQPDGASDNLDTFSIDYVRIYDTEYSVQTSSIANGAVNVSADTELKFSLSSDISADSRPLIAVAKKGGAKVFSELAEVSAKNYAIKFPVGLEHDTEYVASFPGTVKDSAGNLLTAKEITFTTAKAPLVFGDAVIRNQSGATVDAAALPAGITSLAASFPCTNTTGLEKSAVILLGVYDAGGSLLNMSAVVTTIAPGNTSPITGGTLEITGDIASKVKTAKAFLWGEFNQLH